MVAGAAQNGSWRVVGNSGSVPVHALPFTNELVLFMQRGNNGNGTAYDSDLQVSPRPRFILHTKGASTPA